MDPKEILGWVILGLVAGLIARKVMPGAAEKGGCLITIALGILGAVVGGWIGRHVGFLPPVTESSSGLPSLQSILTATVGALVVLALWKWLRR